jgi:trigger factor
MNITVLENKKVKYTFEVTPDEFAHGLEHAYEHAKKDVEVKGFRKGHVPFSIFEKKYGIEMLFEDALNHVLSHKYQEVVADTTHEVVSDPEIDLDYKKVSRDNPFEVSLIFDVKPDVTLGNYKGLEATYPKTTVKASDVDLELQQMLKKDGTLEPKEGELLVGDTAIFDFEGFLEGKPFEGGKAENYELEIGSNQFIPGFEEQMVGMTHGEEKDLNVTFPENYQAENLKGKAVVFKVKLHDIKTKKPAELNDTWVESLKREEKTVDTLKEALKKELKDKKEKTAKQQFENDVITKVLAGVTVDIPESMIKKEAQGQIEQIKNQAKQYNIPYEQFLQFSGMTPEMFEKQAETDAASRVKMNLVFEAVAHAEKLEVSEEKIDTEYKNLAEKHKLELDYVKKVVTKEQLKKDLLPQLGYELVIESAVKK